MSLAFLIAIVLGAITDAASVRPALVNVAVSRDARRVQRALRSVASRCEGERERTARRPSFRAQPFRRMLAPLTGAIAPRAPAACC